MVVTRGPIPSQLQTAVVILLEIPTRSGGDQGIVQRDRRGAAREEAADPGLSVAHTQLVGPICRQGGGHFSRRLRLNDDAFHRAMAGKWTGTYLRLRGDVYTIWPPVAICSPIDLLVGCAEDHKQVGSQIAEI